VDRSSPEDLERIASVLTEATLNNIAYFGPSAAMVTGTFNDEDLWGPQLGAASTEGDVLVPEEMQTLPDESTRQFLVSLYYKVLCLSCHNPVCKPSSFWMTDRLT